MARQGGLYEDRSLPLTADINLINLVDVAFTLLVIFMITAPILQGGVEVQLPQAEVAPLPASEAIVVTVDDEGVIYIGDASVSLDEFRAVIDADSSDAVDYLSIDRTATPEGSDHAERIPASIHPAPQRRVPEHRRRQGRRGLG